MLNVKRLHLISNKNIQGECYVSRSIVWRWKGESTPQKDQCCMSSCLMHKTLSSSLDCAVVVKYWVKVPRPEESRRGGWFPRQRCTPGCLLLSLPGVRRVLACQLSNHVTALVWILTGRRLIQCEGVEQVDIKMATSILSPLHPTGVKDSMIWLQTLQKTKNGCPKMAGSILRGDSTGSRDKATHALLREGGGSQAGPQLLAGQRQQQQEHKRWQWWNCPCWINSYDWTRRWEKTAQKYAGMS